MQLSAIGDEMLTVEASRAKLLRHLVGAPNVTFIRSWGNVGDQLIYAGTRRLLADIPYVEVGLKDLSDAGGHTAVLSGGGAWCQRWHVDMTDALPVLESRFKRVIIFPSSFDVSAQAVRKALSNTKALVFARERVSYQQIQGLCTADIAHDCAFFFDYSPYLHAGEGLLSAYRTDKESALGEWPSQNRDISAICDSLDQWLWLIARHESIETDRAHVMIAAALLGKQVEYQEASYHKVTAIAQFSLRDYPVRRQAAQLRDTFPRQDGHIDELPPRADTWTPRYRDVLEAIERDLGRGRPSPNFVTVARIAAKLLLDRYGVRGGGQ